MRQFTVIAVGIVASVLAGNLWWILWMNHGWFGPPGVLAGILKVDGEAAYDAILLEMILIIAAILASVAIGYQFYSRVRQPR